MLRSAVPLPPFRSVGSPDASPGWLSTSLAKMWRYFNALGRHLRKLSTTASSYVPERACRLPACEVAPIKKKSPNSRLSRSSPLAPARRGLLLGFVGRRLARGFWDRLLPHVLPLCFRSSIFQLQDSCNRAPPIGGGSFLGGGLLGGGLFRRGLPGPRHLFRSFL